MSDEPGGPDIYRVFFEQAVEGIFQTTPEGGYLRVNPALAQLYGYDTPAELQREVTDIAQQIYVRPERRGEFVEAILREGAVQDFEAEVRRRDGRRIWIAANARAVYDEQGQVRCFEGCVHDITRRKEAEEALAYRFRFEALITSISTELIRSASDEIPDRIHDALQRLGEFCEVDRSYVFLYRDEGRRLHYAYEWCADGVASFKQVIPDLPSNTFPWFDAEIKAHRAVYVPRVADLPPAAAAVRAEWEREGILSIACLPITCAGQLHGFIGLDAVREERRWTDDSLALLRIVGEILGNAIHRRGLQRQRSLLERRMRDAQKLESLGVLAGGIAHDFNNLLMGILGSAELTAMDLGEGHPAAEHLARIRLTTQRAAELTEQLLAYSGKGRVQLAPLDVSALLQDLTQLIEAMLAGSAEPAYDLTPGLPAVEADAGQVRQMVLSLVANASEALANSPGRIRLRTGVRELTEADLLQSQVELAEPRGQFVYIEVSDNGSGMDETTRQRVFDPFFSTKFTGRGLGLAAVLGMVQSHGGAIRVESEPGEGTTVTIFFHASARPVGVRAGVAAGRSGAPED